MDLIWMGGQAVRVVGRGAAVTLDGGVEFPNGRRFGRPGEYDVQDVAVVGVQSRAGDRLNTVFSAYVDDLAVCHLGALSEPLRPDQIDAIGPVDVLLLPLDAGLDGQAAADAVAALDPRVVVPLGDPVAVEAFCRLTGAPVPVPQNKLTYTSASMPEVRVVAALNPPKTSKNPARKAA